MYFSKKAGHLPPLFLMALDLQNGRNDAGAPFNDFQKGC
jgi:hypothetical protein